ncbi:penicillin-binding protein 2 [Tatumella ptyseos]|uniref:Penicillin-binding protein 2 n=1 Tax=Tatumella ptyseos TaxID=82987 RepID=A0A2X5NGY6_9GAMM|nr:penicillin-binding protein 2 [Tatumella ptyseos]
MNLRNFEIEEKLFIRRAITAFVLVAVCFGILVYNLYRLQICEHSYYQTRSNDNDIKMIPIAPTRGLSTIAMARRWYAISLSMI